MSRLAGRFRCSSANGHFETTHWLFLITTTQQQIFNQYLFKSMVLTPLACSQLHIKRISCEAGSYCPLCRGTLIAATGGQIPVQSSTIAVGTQTERVEVSSKGRLTSSKQEPEH
jgi:hypothetical protein